MNKERGKIVLQIILFIVTFITVTLSGAYWVPRPNPENFGWEDFYAGMQFSIPFLLFLTVHEFGHYFTARYYNVKATLPFYIPFPSMVVGTLGAVIRLLSPIQSKKINFDVGIAGPLAGFAVGVMILFYGFYTLPPADHIFTIHPEYKQYGMDYAKTVYKNNENTIDISVGKNLLFLFMEHVIADPARMPNPHEIIHYPYLFAGFLALVFTFLNLMPIGQLDGGHVLYGLVGTKRHGTIASVIFVMFMFYAGLGNRFIDLSKPPDYLAWSIPGYVMFLYLAFQGLKLSQRDTIMYAVVIFAIQFLLAKFLPDLKGFESWAIFGFIVSRFVGIHHPPSEIEEPLDNTRIIIGWLALLIFVLCFSPAPLIGEVT